MGYEYYLAKDDTRELFELGKSRTGFSFPLRELENRKTKTFILSDPEILSELLLEGMQEYGSWDGDLEDWKEVANKVAKRLVEW